MITDSERPYDIGNKGYLTKFERQLKELDDEVDVFTIEPTPTDEEYNDGRESNNNNNHGSLRRFSTSPHDLTAMDDSFETEKNYKHYLNKVQRDFEEVELQHKKKRAFTPIQNNKNYDGNNDNNRGNATTMMGNSNNIKTCTENGPSAGLFRSSRPWGACTRNKTTTWHDSSSWASMRPPSASNLVSSSAPSSYDTLKAIILGLIVALVICNTAVSWMSWKAIVAKELVPVDSSSGLLVSTNDDGSIMTAFSAGLTVELAVMPSHNTVADDGAVDDAADTHDGKQPHYACIAMHEAVHLWQSTKQGISPTVTLVHANEHGNGEEQDHRILEYGVRLTFQGATRNETHACLPTHNDRQTLCVDFESNLCANNSDSSYYDEKGREFVDDNDSEPSQETSVAGINPPARRDLFATMIENKKQWQSGSRNGGEYQSHRGQRSRAKGECYEMYGPWCNAVTPIFLIANVQSIRLV